MNIQKFSMAHIQHCKSPGMQARAELKTWDDTSCGGEILWLHKLNGKICSVSLFSASFDPMKDVHISTCLTAYTD